MGTNTVNVEGAALDNVITSMLNAALHQNVTYNRFLIMVHQLYETAVGLIITATRKKLIHEWREHANTKLNSLMLYFRRCLFKGQARRDV